MAKAMFISPLAQAIREAAPRDSRRCVPLLALDAAFEGGRMLVGAVGAAYLLTKGLSLGDIARIKLIQGVILFLGEVPTGIVADLFGRRTSLVLSAVSGSAGFLAFALGDSFAAFACGESLLALSLCFWSGAYEAYAIEHSWIDGNGAAITRFFHRAQAWGQAAVMLAGLLGGVLAAMRFETAYWLASAAFATLAVTIRLFPADRSAPRGTTVFTEGRKHVTAIWMEGLADSRVSRFFWVGLGIQFAIQPLIHYWQPYFQAISPGMDGAGLGLVFFAYCLATALSGSLTSAWLRGVSPESQRLKRIAPTAFLLAGVAWAGLGSASGPATGIAWLCLLQAALATGRSRLAAGLSLAAPSASRASVISGASLFSRLGMLLSLALLGSALNPRRPATTLASLYSITGLAFVAAVLAHVIWNRRTRKALIRT